MEYYSAIKGNKIELFVVRWMDLDSVIQSEIRQKEKNKYCMLTRRARGLPVNPAATKTPHCACGPPQQGPHGPVRHGWGAACLVACFLKI